MVDDAKSCPQCRAVAPAKARFCPQCGAPLAADAPATTATSGERRQVAILFVDLTGFTALSRELDPEDVHRLLTRYFEQIDGLIGQCGGAIDKHIGDAVMGVFGAPVAYGNDTLRALRAAVGAHAAMAALSRESGRELSVHIGVASGEVVAADTGSAVHRTYTVTGDAVNLAARLNELAHAGETVISDDVQRTCASFIEADPVGSIAIRGFTRDMPVWKLRSLRVEADAEHPLIGRELEVGAFLAMLDDADREGRGAMWVVRADPGMGKTRLVQELTAHARRRGVPVHAGMALDFGAAQGRDMIYMLFASLVGVAPDASDDERGAGLDRAIAAGWVAPDDAPFAADLLVLPQRGAAMYEAMDNAARTEGKLRLLAAVVERVGAGRPLVALIEDVHWATLWSLACLRRLADCTARMPLVVVCTSRREGDPFGVPPLDIAVRCCDLPALSTRDALTLARSYLTTHPDVAQGCVDRAQGNPLFLTQLLRSGADGNAIPGTIQSVVLSRLDRLAPADKAALQAAAVVGQRFDLVLLRHLLDDPSYDAGVLLGRDFVRADAADARRFAFVHALIRDGAYASLLHSARRTLHARAADWFAGRDAVLHAEHLDRADDPRAAAAYLAAAQNESASLRVDAALRLVRRGAELAAAPDVRHHLARLEGDLARTVGDAAVSLAAFERALVHAQDDAQRCDAFLGIAEAHRATGATDRGLAALASAEPLAAGAGLAREASRAAYLRGCFEFARGDTRASQLSQERARELAHAAGDAAREAQALSGLADVMYADGRMISAYAAFGQCVALCDREGLTRISLANRCMLAIVHAFLEPADFALPELDRVRVSARELRQPLTEVMASECEGWVRITQGMYAEAVAPGEHSLSLAREIGARRWILYDLAILAHAYWHVGRRDEARVALRDAFLQAEELGVRFVGGLLHGARALMVDDASDLARVIDDGELSLASGNPAHSHFWFRRAAIDALLAAGDYDGAERQADALDAFTQAEPVPWATLYAARARALADAGRGSADPAALVACRARAFAMHLPGALPALDAALARCSSVQ